MDERRCRLLIDRAIRTLRLDLRRRVVLTEAATGYYVLTPLIAALAGAETVLALTRDSVYGPATEVAYATEALASRWGVGDRVDVLLDRTSPRLGDADIVTNLGFVRPLDAPFLQGLKPTAVIPLMWETWEFRAEDLDLPECRRLGIPVLGTNEHHPDLRIFGYIGHVALKLLLSVHIEVFRSRIAVLGSGEFGEQTATTLSACGAHVERLLHSTLGDPEALRAAVTDADALVVVEHNDRRPLLGPNGAVTAEALGELSPALAITHICGNVDRESLEAAGFPLAPERFAPAGHMSVALDHVGPRPVVDLHAAGLKVGELLAAARERGLGGLDAEAAVLEESGLAQGFPQEPDGSCPPAKGRHP